MIVVVGSNARNAGKTTLICAMLREWAHLGWSVLKVTPHAHLHESGDTERFRRAGARKAWLCSMANLPDLASGNWIIESNRILDLLQPDAYIFLEALGPPDEKPRSRWHLRQAQVHLKGWTPTDLLPGEVKDLISSLLR